MYKNTLFQPKEKNKAGDIVGDTEKTSTDKKRERRHKKKVKHFKIKEKEQKMKLKEASQADTNKKPSKAQAREDLKKLTKGGKATILKVSGLCTTEIQFNRPTNGILLRKMTIEKSPAHFKNVLFPFTLSSR